mmetsp:Transcript_115492/g.309695  ORF Transcript_115492/g.309695 Transcript_115492/m.309695 type:complete len:384 (-) Transcript_115492:584-1735(-)
MWLDQARPRWWPLPHHEEAWAAQETARREGGQRRRRAEVGVVRAEGLEVRRLLQRVVREQEEAARCQDAAAGRRGPGSAVSPSAVCVEGPGPALGGLAGEAVGPLPVALLRGLVGRLHRLGGLLELPQYLELADIEGLAAAKRGLHELFLHIRVRVDNQVGGDQEVVPQQAEIAALHGLDVEVFQELRVMLLDFVLQLDERLDGALRLRELLGHAQPEGVCGVLAVLQDHGHDLVLLVELLLQHLHAIIKILVSDAGGLRQLLRPAGVFGQPPGDVHEQWVHLFHELGSFLRHLLEEYPEYEAPDVVALRVLDALNLFQGFEVEAICLPPVGAAVEVVSHCERQAEHGVQRLGLAEGPHDISEVGEVRPELLFLLLVRAHEMP